MNVTENGKEYLTWVKPENENTRYVDLDVFATDCGLATQFRQIPPVYFKSMTMKEYWINALAMAKIRELKRLADHKQETGRVDW
jgi:hypothetical protein